ncbi:MAG: histidine phosphatase family protein [Verrucomicrobia bacterium]|nr:histidine phosphatase family protein [Verrucomicrobiota bacterium]
MKYLFAICLAATSIWSQPSQVILIRHAEKPAQGNYLSLKGRQRAAALVPSFLGSPLLLQNGQPAAIYAMKPTATDPSVRSVQTVLVLAEELDLPLHNQFALGQIEPLVQEIMSSEDYEGKTVLICWPHTELPQIASLFGAKEIPKRWSEDTYDRFWVLSFSDSGAVSFQNLPQKLLYGDSNR